MNWTEDDYMNPEQEREIEAREECARRGIDPDEICADGGVTAWMVVDKEIRDPLGASLEVARGYREMLETQRARIEALEAVVVAGDREIKRSHIDADRLRTRIEWLEWRLRETAGEAVAAEPGK